MNRFGSLFWFGMAMATGFAMFMVKYAVQNLEADLVRVQKQTVAEQLEIRVLHAEWSYLTQPERLAALNKQFLSLAPTATKQFEQSIADIPLRAVPEPPAELTAAAQPPASRPVLPGSDLPVTPVALNTPAGAVPQAVRPAHALDELFAQIAGQR